MAPGRMGAPFPHRPRGAGAAGHGDGEGVTVPSHVPPAGAGAGGWRRRFACAGARLSTALCRACPGLSVNFYPFAVGSGCRGGREEGWIAPGPPHGKVG